jgi:FSR family fosmidomycin resistance protein-like MFS transporter
MPVQVATVEPTLLPDQARAVRAAWWSLGYLCLGHFAVDLYSNAWGVFTPVLIERLGLTLSQAGLLGGLLSFSSSVTQPLFGILSDRFRSPLFATLAPAASGVLIASLGLAPNFTWLAVMILLGGLGISSFHPSGSSRVALGLDHRRQQAMAIFISSGTLGLAFGPTFFSYLFRTVGVERAHWGALPGLLITAWLVWALPPQQGSIGPRPNLARDWRALLAQWQPLTILYFCVFFRSVVQIAMSVFLPLYLSRERGMRLDHASWVLSFYLIAGALGGFIGGNLANRWGGKRIIQASFLLSVPCLAVFYLSTGPLAIAFFLLGGLTLLFTIPVNVVMAQEIAPAQAGTVSALMMGFSWGMAGLVAIPLVGRLAESFGLHHTLFALLLAPVLGFLLTLRLKA